MQFKIQWYSTLNLRHNAMKHTALMHFTVLQCIHSRIVYCTVFSMHCTSSWTVTGLPIIFPSLGGSPVGSPLPAKVFFHMVTAMRMNIKWNWNSISNWSKKSWIITSLRLLLKAKLVNNVLNESFYVVTQTDINLNLTRFWPFAPEPTRQPAIFT